MLRNAREQHSLRVREAFSNKNCKQLWDSVKDILNFKKGEALHVSNEMEDFYLRFDCDANRVLEECNSVLSSVTCDELS